MTVASHADEAGDDDDHILLEQRKQRGARGDFGAREVGRGVAVATVRLDEKRRVDDDARRSICPEHPTDDLRRGALAVRENRIAKLRAIGVGVRERREVRCKDVGERSQRAVDGLVLFSFREGAGDARVPLGDLFHDRLGAARIAFRRAVHGAQKRIGHTLERRGDGDAPFLGRLCQQRTNMTDRGGVRERGAAELVDGDRMCGWGMVAIGPTYGNW